MTALIAQSSKVSAPTRSSHAKASFGFANCGFESCTVTPTVDPGDACVGSNVSVVEVVTLVVVVVELLVVVVEVLDEVDEIVLGTLLVVGCAPPGWLPAANDEMTIEPTTSAEDDMRSNVLWPETLAESGRRREHTVPTTFHLLR